VVISSLVSCAPAGVTAAAAQHAPAAKTRLHGRDLRPMNVSRPSHESIPLLLWSAFGITLQVDGTCRARRSGFKRSVACSRGRKQKRAVRQSRAVESSTGDAAAAMTLSGYCVQPPHPEADGPGPIRERQG
jgi:hypothetical protein